MVVSVHFWVFMKHHNAPGHADHVSGGARHSPAAARAASRPRPGTPSGSCSRGHQADPIDLRRVEAERVVEPAAKRRASAPLRELTIERRMSLRIGGRSTAVELVWWPELDGVIVLLCSSLRSQDSALELERWPR